MIHTEDWARENDFTQAQCVHEYHQHGLARDDLIRDLGDHANYRGADILSALGY